MKLNFKTDSLVKTALLSAGAALLLSACGEKTASPTAGAAEGRSAFETSQDHALGNPDAPITVVEYASVTCGHCATWKTQIWPKFRKKYVDTGKVRFVFREFPTSPVDLAMAGHLLANCAPDDKYFDVLHAQFERQREILSSTDVKGEYIRLAKSAGMSEADFNACMTNQTEIDRLNDVVNKGFEAGVTGTPTFFVNGKQYSTAELFQLEDFDKKFAEILGEPVANDAEKSETQKDDTSSKTGH